MAEYIERNAFRDVLANSHKSHAENYRDEVLLARDIRLLNEQPTADVVEVVRCKDCKNRNTPDCAMYYVCMDCGGQWSWENDDCFCSFGER